MSLNELGWNSFFQSHWDASPGRSHVPARVIGEQRGAYRLASESGEMVAELGGGLRYRATGRAELPAVGDWVAVEIRSEGRAKIHRVLPRKSKFSRNAAGDQVSEQVVAANIDTIFLITSLNTDLKLRRIERYLSMVWESGASPVILLNKTDLAGNVTESTSQVGDIAIGVPVHAISAKTGEGIEALGTYLGVGQTVAFLGSSGVGKSTLVNRLLGAEVQLVREIRESDERGQHTTTSRRILKMEGGGLLMDTPGMRELQLWDTESGIDQTFEDVLEFALGCRFTDCEHESEPGCAVRQALADGVLQVERFDSYMKLRKEASFLNRKQDVLARVEEKKRWKKISQTQREHYKGGRKPEP